MYEISLAKGPLPNTAPNSPTVTIHPNIFGNFSSPKPKRNNLNAPTAAPEEPIPINNLPYVAIVKSSMYASGANPATANIIHNGITFLALK